MLAYTILTLSFVAAAHAIPLSAGISTSCNNGLFCAFGQTCMSQEQGAGAMLACSPHINATLCMDRRYSCPSGSTCFNSLCTPSDGGPPFNASWSLDATSVGLRTYGKGIFILPTDTPGHVMDLGSDICNLANRFLPSFCKCHSDAWSEYGAQVRCDVSVGNFMQSFVHAWFEPCGQRPRIGYTYGVNIAGNQLLEEKKDFDASYQVKVGIPGARVVLYGNGLSTDIVLSGQIYDQTVEAGISLDVCGRVNIPLVKGYKCASDMRIVKDFFQSLVNVQRK